MLYLTLVPSSSNWFLDQKQYFLTSRQTISGWKGVPYLMSLHFVILWTQSLLWRVHNLALQWSITTSRARLFQCKGSFINHKVVVAHGCNGCYGFILFVLTSGHLERTPKPNCGWTFVAKTWLLFIYFVTTPHIAPIRCQKLAFNHKYISCVNEKIVVMVWCGLKLQPQPFKYT